MSINQISVFLENRSGQLAEVTRLLGTNGVDIRAISIAETSDYGLARMIVDDAAKASSVLLSAGVILSMNPVCAVEVPDSPNGLAELLTTIADGNIDLEYMYSLFTHKEGKAYMVLRVSNETLLAEALVAHNIKVMTAGELGIK